jgi:hypothetical protein
MVFPTMPFPGRKVRSSDSRCRGYRRPVLGNTTLGTGFVFGKASDLIVNGNCPNTVIAIWEGKPIKKDNTAAHV